MNYLYTLAGIIIGILLSLSARPVSEGVDDLLDKVEKAMQSETKGRAVFIDPLTKQMKWDKAEEVDDLLIK